MAKGTFPLRRGNKVKIAKVSGGVMSSKDRLDALIDELEGAQPSLKRTKVNFSFRLDFNNMKALQKYCQAKGVSTGVLVDRLIADFLERLEERKKGGK